MYNVSRHTCEIQTHHTCESKTQPPRHRPIDPTSWFHVWCLGVCVLLSHVWCVWISHVCLDTLYIYTCYTHEIKMWGLCLDFTDPTFWFHQDVTHFTSRHRPHIMISSRSWNHDVGSVKSRHRPHMWKQDIDPTSWFHVWCLGGCVLISSRCDTCEIKILKSRCFIKI